MRKMHTLAPNEGISAQLEAAARPPSGGPGRIPGRGPEVSATQLR